MRPEKQLLLDEIEEEINNAPALLVTRYAGLNAELATQFRNVIRDCGGRFRIVPKRLLLRAASTQQFDLQNITLEGHLALVSTGEDPVQTAKAVFTFGKDNGDAVQVLGGQVDGVVYGREEIEQISKLPSLNEMRAQLLGLFVAPMTQTLSVMQALLTSVIYCLDNKAKAGGESS